MDYEVYDTGESRFVEGDIFINEIKVIAREPYHAHNFIEIVMVKSGSGWHIVNGNKFRIEAGDIIIVDYDTPHKSVSDDGRLVVLNCLFTSAFIDTKFSAIRSFADILRSLNIHTSLSDEFSSYLYLKPSFVYGYKILEIYEAMLNEYTKKRTGYITFLRGNLLELITLLIRISEETGNEQIQIVNKIKRYVIENYKKNVSLDDIAANVFLSKQYICKLFKENTNTTIIHFMQQIRIDEAIRLIISTDKKISCIANAVGYSDLKYFNYVFKKVTDKTPSQFRRLYHM